MVLIEGACVLCGMAIKQGRSFYREVNGWEKATTNSITDREYTGRVRCAACSIEHHHPSLFEEGVPV